LSVERHDTGRQAMEERERFRLFILEVFTFTNAKAGLVMDARLQNDVFAQAVQTAPLRGLRTAANDMIERSIDLPDADVAVLDERLRLLGAPTLSAMRDRRYRDLLRIIASNRIRSEEEWHLVNGFVSDGENSLSQAERQRADELLWKYQRRAP
jgi:hypothetical protein